MAAIRHITLGSRTVTIKELTVGEVRDWLTEVENERSEDPVHALALAECSLSDLARMSDIAAGSMEAFTPSELGDLVKACKDLNPHFFRVRAALSGVARMMLEGTSPPVLTETP